MSISVPADRLTPFNPGGPGFCGWGGAPHGFGVAPGARGETGSAPCEVKTLETHSVRVQIAADWGEREGDKGRLHRLVRHGEVIDGTAGVAAPFSPWGRRWLAERDG